VGPVPRVLVGDDGAELVDGGGVEHRRGGAVVEQGGDPIGLIAGERDPVALLDASGVHQAQ
jgi:hypothetical protein